MTRHTYQELVERAARLTPENGRSLLAVVGAPGSGKSTLANSLVDSLNRPHAKEIAICVPMDGFHLANEALSELGLTNRKGAIETFDGWGFLNLAHRLHQDYDHTIWAPNFDRSLEEAVAGSIAVRNHHRLVILEGNYIGLDVDPGELSGI